MDASYREMELRLFVITLMVDSVVFLHSHSHQFKDILICCIKVLVHSHFASSLLSVASLSWSMYIHRLSPTLFALYPVLSRPLQACVSFGIQHKVEQWLSFHIIAYVEHRWLSCLRTNKRLHNKLNRIERRRTRMNRKCKLHDENGSRCSFAICF